MKSIALITFCFLFANSVAQTQSDIINSDVPLVFLGADFSRIKFTKADEFNNKDQILRFFVDMNSIIDIDSWQNVIGKMLNRKGIKRDFSYVTARNASVDWQTVYSDDTDYVLTEETINDMIIDLVIDREKYKDHIGLVLCEENYCKTNTKGNVAVVFFNVNNNQLLFIKHCSYKPSGYGFYYYWKPINLRVLASLRKIKKEIG